MTVKFGIQNGTNLAFLRMKTQDYIKSIQFTEEAGYESAFVMDHLNSSPMQADVPSCEVVLTAGVIHTQNVKIGSCVMDVHRRHPTQVALDSLTLQQLSGNRFILGLGAGEAMNLNEFGVSWNKPATRLREAVEVIKLLWNTSKSKRLTVDYTGEFFQLKNAKLQYPTKILPKLWIGANGPKLIEFTGTNADGWIPSGYNPKLYKKHMEILGKGGRLDEVEKAIEVFVFISDDRPDFAKELGRAYGMFFSLNPEILGEYNISVPEEISLHNLMKRASLSEFIKARQECMEFASNNIPEEVADSMTIAGSSDDCIAQINDYIKAGVEHFLIEIYGVGNYFDALKLFTNKVFSYYKENS